MKKEIRIKPFKVQLEEEFHIQTKDPRKEHFYVSLVKSFLRIIAGVYLCSGNIFAAGGFLIIAECLGILEEIV